MSVSLFLMTVFRVHYLAASLTSAQSPAHSVRQADIIQLLNLPLDSPDFRSAALPHQISLISPAKQKASTALRKAKTGKKLLQ